MRFYSTGRAEPVFAVWSLHPAVCCLDNVLAVVSVSIDLFSVLCLFFLCHVHQVQHGGLCNELAFGSALYGFSVGQIGAFAIQYSY